MILFSHKPKGVGVLTMPIMVSALFSISAGVEIEALPGTKPLTMEGDVASEMVAGIDKFLLRELDASVEQRAKHWKRDFSSSESYIKSIEPNRKRLAHILGNADARVPSPLPKGVGGCLFDGPELVGTTDQPALVGRGDGYEVYAARWPAFGDVHGEGLLLVPTKGKPIANIVAIPDADQTPEQISGLVEGVAAESQYARRLAESGCRVIGAFAKNSAKGGHHRRQDRFWAWRVPQSSQGEHLSKQLATKQRDSRR